MADLEYNIKLRNDTSANFTSVNPTLYTAEIAYETDTKRIKIGDGITAWVSLPYQFLTLNDKGVPNGVVPLNASGEIDASYINQVAVAVTTAFTPSGNIVASNVQSAIEELDSEKEPVIPTGSSSDFVRGDKTLADFDNTVGAALHVTGIISGGEVTLNTDTSKVDISPCVYYIQGVKYSYPGVTAYSPPFGATETARRLGLDSTGLVSQQGNFSDSQKQTILPIARLQAEQGSAGPGSLIIPPIDQRFPISEFGYIDRVWRERVFGALYTETGGMYVEDSTPLHIDQTAGMFFDAQGKRQQVSATSHISAKMVYHISGVWQIQPDIMLVVPTTQYDNGTDLVTLTDTYWTSHTLLKSPKSQNEFFLVIGKSQHATQTEAEAVLPNYGPFMDEATSNLIAVAKIIVRKDATSINRIVNIQPRIKGSSNQTSGIAALLPTVSNPEELVNYEDAWRIFNSTSVVYGCDATDNGNGTINISEGEVVIRTQDTDAAPLVVYKVGASSVITPTDNAVSYISMFYNNGSPTWQVGNTIFDYNGTDLVQAYTISRRGNSLWIIDSRRQAVDGNRKSRRRDLEWSGTVDDGFWHARGGANIASSGLNLTLTAGRFYYGLSLVTNPAFNTSVAGLANSNVFDYYYNRTAYTYTANQKTISNTQYDNAGTLTALSPGRYRTDWVYLLLDGGTPRLIVVFGATQHNTLALAQAELTPTVKPAFMQGSSILVGRVIALEGSTTLNVATPFVSYTFQ